MTLSKACLCSLCKSQPKIAGKQQPQEQHLQNGIEDSSSSSSSFDFQVSVLPPSVRGMLTCAQYQIGQLDARATAAAATGSSSTTTANGDEGEDADAYKSALSSDDEDALDDGFLCIDVNVLTTKLSKWYQLFPNVTPYFAIKCNPDPMVVHWLARHACQSVGNPVGFDCASLQELIMAKRELVRMSNQDKGTGGTGGDNILTSMATRRIVYANPQRAEADLLTSLTLFPLDQPLMLTLDGVEELSKMSQACRQAGRDPETLELIVRILVPDGESQVPLGEKFGMVLESIKALVKQAHHPSFGFTKVIGVSFHCGSGCHDPQTYQTALELADNAIEIINAVQTEQNCPKCWLLDMGGGFPGFDGIGGDRGRFMAGTSPTEEVPALLDDDEEEEEGTGTTADIARAIRPKLQDLESKHGLTLISEPGRYFVEGSACLVSRIYKMWTERDASNGEDCHVYQIAHGVYGVFKDVLLCNEAFVPKPLKHDLTHEDSNTVLLTSRVRGPSGDVQDIVCAECRLPKLEVGDWLVFDRMGAYTVSIATRTGRPIIKFVQGGGDDKKHLSNDH